MNRYRLFRRSSGRYFIQDNRTGKQESLKTSNKEEAERLFLHRNEAHRTTGANRAIAAGYLSIADPEIKTRNWAHVMKYFCEQPCKDSTKKRKLTAIKDPALKALRSVILIDTNPEQFFSVLNKGTVSTNCYLRKFHNLARDMKWLHEDVLTRKMWPVVRYGEKRAITLEEHRKIVAATHTLERQKYYQVLWETGASQSDIAKLTAEKIDWVTGSINFVRMKLDGTSAGRVNLLMGPTLENLVATLPRKGLLFPGLAKVGENDRATVFARTCEKLGIEGVTLHSYRYSLIQRAKACGYPKRHAMAMVGQSREQTHDNYAAGARVTVPSMEEYEVAHQTVQQQRLESREERRKKIIDMKAHLDQQSDLAQEKSSAA